MKIIIFIALLLAVSYSAGVCECDDGQYFIAAKTSGKAECKNYPTSKDTANPHKYVKDCAVYSFDGTNAICQSCKTAFFLKDNTCTSKVTTAVKDCKYHSSATECMVCNDKFNLNTQDKKKCVAVTKVDNCEQPIANAEGVSICGKCKATHPILKAGKCSAIEKCSKYDATKCIECTAKFFVNNDGSKCVAYPTAAKVITNCEKYETNNTADEFQCQECAAKNFLNADKKKCIAFPTSIGNCSVYVSNGTADEGKCGECAKDFYANFDGTKCIAYSAKTAPIDNCEIYETNGSADASQCGKCKANFFTNNNNSKCVAYPTTDKTKIAGCSVYVTNATEDEFKCGKCEAKKWLKTDGSACINQTENKYCAKFEWNGTAESCPMCADKAYENKDNVCAVCPALKKDKKKEQKDKNSSASVASFCLVSVVLAIITIV